jgi:hypothetical protein
MTLYLRWLDMQVKKARGFNTLLEKCIPARENMDKTFGSRHTLYQLSKRLLILLLEINELANPAHHVREAELYRSMANMSKL